MSFALNVSASLLGTLLFAVVVALFSKQARWIMIAIYSRFIKADLLYVFRNKKDCNSDLEDELNSALNVRIFTGRGDELRREELFRNILKKKPRVDVRVLLPFTEECTGSDWTADREGEMESFEPGHNLRAQIEINAEYLETHGAAVRRYNFPHVGRIVLTERVAYFTPYRSDAHGRRSQIYKFRRGPMYDSYSRLFEKLWEATDQVPGSKESDSVTR